MICTYFLVSFDKRAGPKLNNLIHPLNASNGCPAPYRFHKWTTMQALQQVQWMRVVGSLPPPSVNQRKVKNN